MFHVEISAGLHRARVFNLNREDLLAKVVEPWLDGPARSRWATASGSRGTAA